MSQKRKRITRREFLRDAALATGTVALAGMIPTQARAGQASEPKLGARLIGKLEGPELVLDPAKWPKKFNEAPVLAELVKAGKLPPVEKRIPEEPMVVKPVHSIGKYGGTWRRGFTGPGDGENGNRIVSTDKILFWDYTGNKVMPCLAWDWKVSDDGRVIAILLRKGHKWSDGQPFTADDFIFWYEDVYLNKDLQPTPNPDFMVNGKPGTLRKRDDYTVVFEFPDPNYLFVDILAGSTAMGGGQATQQHFNRTMGAYMPGHYLKQFHSKYVSREEVDRKAKAAGFDGWVSYIKNRWDWRLNPELPVLGPWKTVSPINTPNWALERNPYYYGVDTQGNQLPYIDRISMTLAENLEVLNLRAIAGQYDLQERHTGLTKLPVFLENRGKGNYDVRLDPALNGSDATLQTNQAYEADPEIAKWLQTRDFRRALSLGIERDQLNETFWLGVGTPGSVAPAESLPYSPGPEWRKKWSTHNPKQANELLDKVGLSKKDGEGYRLRTDGKGRLRLELLTAAGAFIPHTQIAEMIKEQWKKIGIQGDVKEVERSLFFTKIKGNEHQISIWLNDGSEVLYLFPRHALPVDPVEAMLGHPIADWYASGGAKGKEPKDAQLKKALELFRTAAGKKTQERYKIAQEIWKIMVDEQFSIGTVGQSPAAMGVRIVSKKLGNIPSRQVNAQHARTPNSSHPATFYYKA
ncbi:MAG: twin-arginine translocation signal domain-containing protein [candidate division NC10 bacterium]|nr:twin-arginine translocation signal domain-containing protein [candidate division NC10 bacterium]